MNSFNISNELINKCSAASREMRADVIKMTYNAGNTGAHIGGSLSMIEIMAALFIGVLKYKAHDKNWEDRDRFILSKGHGAMAQYAVMKQICILSETDLLTFKKNETALYAHPSINMDIGIEFSSGSLGQGLSLGVGVSLALKRKKNDLAHVFILLGDGECDEGSVWEAAASATHYNLNNITVIIDNNGLQYDGKTQNILNMDYMSEKWLSFGWDVYTVDGHDIKELLIALSKKNEKPNCIIANTVKGKGVSFMENEASWHNGRLNSQQYQQALNEQEAIDND